MPENNFTSNFSSLAKKYGPAMLIASLAMGAGNSYLASKAKPANETARQRRNRLLRSFFSPAATTAIGLTALGAAKSLWDSPNINSKSLNKALAVLNKKSGLDEFGEPKTSLSDIMIDKGVELSTPALATGFGMATGSKLVGTPLVGIAKEWGPNARSVTRSIFAKLKGKDKIKKLIFKNPKARVIANLLDRIQPSRKANNNFDTHIAPIIKSVPAIGGGLTGYGIENYVSNSLQNITSGDDLPSISESELNRLLNK